MEEERLLDEYVLNDVGKIWIGNLGSERGREWIFGQFDKSILPACQLLIDRAGLNSVSRGDPIKMARAISRIVSIPKPKKLSKPTKKFPKKSKKRQL